MGGRFEAPNLHDPLGASTARHRAERLPTVAADDGAAPVGARSDHRIPGNSLPRRPRPGPVYAAGGIRMKGRTIGLSLATLLLALPVFAQSHSQKEMQRQEQMHDAQMRAHANASVTVENLKESYKPAAEQRETRATKLSAEDYRALARQRHEL